MPRRISLLLFYIMIIITLCFGISVIPKEKKKKVVKDKFTYTVVKENTELKAIYYGSFKEDVDTQKVTFKCNKNELLSEYRISNKQEFYSYIKVSGPTDKDVVRRKVATDVAYSLVLSGDIIRKDNLNTKQVSYFIDNAHITYNRVPYYEYNNKIYYVINGVNKVNAKDVFIDGLKQISIRKNTLSSRKTTENTGIE